MNYYVLYRISSVFGIQRNKWFYVVLILLSTSLIFTTWIEKTYSNSFTKALYAFSATWLGAVFLLLIGMILFEIIKLFIAPKIAMIGILTVVFLLIVGGIINASMLTIKHLDVEIEGLKEPIKAVQLSDVHIGSIRGNDFLKRIVNTTNEINPDVVFVTGDLVDGSAPLTENMFKELKDLKAPTYFSVGNHEQYEGLAEVLPKVKKSGLKILQNNKTMFKDLQIIGVDFSETKGYLEKELYNTGYEKDKPSVLLFHAPDSFEYAAKQGIDLMLSGHTHGGQIWPFNLLVRLRYSKIKGDYHYLNSTLHVSAGTGTWGPPMRIGTRSEITVINLISKK